MNPPPNPLTNQLVPDPPSRSFVPACAARCREVLRRYGNMSSGSVLFVLDHLRKSREQAKTATKKGIGGGMTSSGSSRDGPKPEWGVALGFGPGVTIEGCLLKLL